MTTKRSGTRPTTRRKAAADSGTVASEVRPVRDPAAPITGVASGSLGTGANLDDTQVMRTADLQRAAAEMVVPAWLTDDAPPLPDEQDAWAGEGAVAPAAAASEPAAAARAVRAREHMRPPERVRPQEPAEPRQRAAAGVGGSRRTSALAGAVVGALLVLLVGAAMLGAMGGFGSNFGGGGQPLADATEAPAMVPTAAPTKVPKDCHGKGKGNDCKD